MSQPTEDQGLPDAAFDAAVANDEEVSKVVLNAYFPAVIAAPSAYRARAAATAGLLSTFVAFLVAVTLNNSDKYIPRIAKDFGVAAMVLLLMAVALTVVASLKPHPAHNSDRWANRVNDRLCPRHHGNAPAKPPGNETIVSYAGRVLRDTGAETERLRRLSARAVWTSVAGITMATVAAALSLTATAPPQSVKVILNDRGMALVRKVCHSSPDGRVDANVSKLESSDPHYRLFGIDGKCEGMTLLVNENSIDATFLQDS